MSAPCGYTPLITGCAVSQGAINSTQDKYSMNTLLVHVFPVHVDFQGSRALFHVKYMHIDKLLFNFPFLVYDTNLALLRNPSRS